MIELREDEPFGKIQRRNNRALCLVAVGSAGVNIVDQLILERNAPENLICVDSDQQVIMGSVAKNTYLVGNTEIYGMGTGGDPELGAILMERECFSLIEHLRGYETIILLTGLGGGTGSGMSPVLCRALKRIGVSVVVFAASPYTFEGNRRRNQAWLASRALYESADALFLFSNNRVISERKQGIDVREQNQLINSMIGISVKSLMDVSTAKGLMEVKLSDLRNATRKPAEDIASLENCWLAHGFGKGEDRMHTVVEDLMTSPYFEDGVAWEEGEYILINLVGGKNMSMAEFQGVMEVLRGEMPADLPIMSNAAVADGVEDYLQVTMMVIGYAEETKRELYVEADSQEDLVFKVHDQLLASKTATDHGMDLSQNEVNAKDDGGEISNHSLPYQHQSNASEDELLLDIKNVFSDGGSQEELPLDSKIALGRFAKSAPTIFKGQNLDQPTFMRLNMQVKL
ncbi:MAG: hypothetical protein AAGA18_02785 [Verrucomicrobiota bacterium]